MHHHGRFRRLTWTRLGPTDAVPANTGVSLRSVDMTAAAVGGSVGSMLRATAPASRSALYTVTTCTSGDSTSPGSAATAGDGGSSQPTARPSNLLPGAPLLLFSSAGGDGRCVQGPADRRVVERAIAMHCAAVHDGAAVVPDHCGDQQSSLHDLPRWPPADAR